MYFIGSVQFTTRIISNPKRGRPVSKDTCINTLLGETAAGTGDILSFNSRYSAYNIKKRISSRIQLVFSVGTDIKYI